MNKLKVSISARLYDHHGHLVRKYRPKAAHSFLAQFIEYLYIQMSQTQTDVTKTDGSDYNVIPAILNLSVNAPASDLNYGLLIGSGTDPVTIDDYVLQSQITSDLTVLAHTFSLSYPSSNTRRLSISRTFTNTSLSPMSIEEVVLYTIYAGLMYFCLDRTLYSVSIPASSSLTLTYRIDVSI
ncbi:unnamed protein product [marine sediment metagenome]|uniref:Uncharacterized protein n=1 Tax=marine sediment metagenome TaxID=412755 RepID=X1LL99_9ZZZZ